MRGRLAKLHRSARIAVLTAPLATTAVRLRRDDGMTTAEYAVGTVATCGFAGLLYKLLTSPEVLRLLSDVIRRAFSIIG